MSAVEACPYLHNEQYKPLNCNLIETYSHYLFGWWWIAISNDGEEYNDTSGLRKKYCVSSDIWRGAQK